MEDFLLEELDWLKSEFESLLDAVENDRGDYPKGQTEKDRSRANAIVERLKITLQTIKKANI